nr:hypothetical protein [Tanacetum cinerariifolium]
MAFISSSKNNSGNVEDNTASVPTPSTQVSPVGPTVAPASISLDTACAYIASQSNGSQIKYEDINQIDEDDIKEMDIKWNMALLSMRADRFLKKTGKKISIQGTDVAGFNKSNGECFNCHKMGHFARECRAPRNQDRRSRDNYRQWSKVEEQAPKALMAIDGVGWDWSYMENDEENHGLVADEEVPTEFALMAKTSTDNEVFDNSLCSKACKKNTDSLNSQITKLSEKLDTYGEIVTLMRRHDDDADKDEEPSAGPDRGSKRRREGKEPESASAPTDTATKSAGRPTRGSQSRQASASESATTEEPMQTTFQMEEPSHLEFDTVAEDQRIVDTLTPKLLAGPTYELMKGSCKSLVELKYHLEEVFKATTDQLGWVNLKGQQYPHNLLKPLPLIPNNRGLQVIPFEHFINNDLEYLYGGASSRKYTTSIIKTKAADYRHINIVIQRRVEDLQLGVESYQKKLNLTKPDSYRSNLKRKEAYTAYSNPRGLIHQNKDKKNRLMWIDEFYKFSDETLTDVRTALDDHLKRIRMQYLPQSIWRKSDKERAATMIQDIDKRLKTRRIMRSLERFIGGRLYEGDFRMLQRTI